MSIKRKLKLSNISKRKPIEEDEELNNQNVKKDINKDDKEYHIKLEKLKAAKNLKLLQDVRLKKKGICVDNSINDKSQMLETEKTGQKLLDKQFTKNVTEKEIEDIHVEEFIKEHMKEFLDELEKGKKGKIEEKEEEEEEEEEKEGEDGEKEKNEDNLKIDDLYKVPEHIRVKSSNADISEKIDCVTGITEIPIPAEMKLMNIEETEKLKRKFLKKAKIVKTTHS